MWGVGLLGFRDLSFYQMDAFDFLILVEGAMRWQVETEDRLWEQQSIFTAYLMQSTGNYKKDVKVEDLRKQVYLPLDDRWQAVEEQIDSEGQMLSVSEIEKKKSDLQKKFNL